MRPRPLLRTLAAAVAVTGSVLIAGEPAGGHATFAEVGVPADSEQRITMFVPEERGPTVHNVGIDLRVPVGWSALGCQQVAPWACQVADGGVIKWTKTPGAAPSDADTRFVFTVRTGSPGMVSVPVVQTYDSGEVVRWIGPADSEEPAAFVEVLPQGAPVPPTTALTTTTSAPAPAPTTTRPAATTASTRPASTATATPTTTTTAAAPTSTTGPPDTAATTTTSVPETSTTASGPEEREVRSAGADTHDDEGGSAAMVLTAVLATTGAAAGWAAWRRRRRAGVDPPA